MAGARRLSVAAVTILVTSFLAGDSALGAGQADMPFIASIEPGSVSQLSYVRIAGAITPSTST